MARGVIHRDIKPSNVMLTIDNDVRIIDFRHCNRQRLRDIPHRGDRRVTKLHVSRAGPVRRTDFRGRTCIRSVPSCTNLLTGFRPFRADNLSKLLHQIVYATPPPIHTYRDDLPEELEDVVAKTMIKDPTKRTNSGRHDGGRTYAGLYKDLRQKYDSLDNQEHFDLLRTLTFFHEFSHAEIWEVLRASDWTEYRDGEDIVKEGEIDDRFYIIVSGKVTVQAGRRNLGSLGPMATVSARRATFAAPNARHRSRPRAP